VLPDLWLGIAVPPLQAERVTYIERNGQPLTLDVYLPPATAQPAPGVLVIHGGGWQSGDSTLEEECLQRAQPTDLGQTRDAVAAFLQRYNAERPNQARTCQNQPPQVAFPDLPTLPRVPEQVDPDG